MAEKKYYYLKLEQDYFNNKIIKALRKKPSGAEMCVVYLKMQLRYLHCEGYIQFNGLCDTMAEEIAMDIDEDVDIVKMTLIALTKWNCIEEVTHDTLYMNECQQRIGSVTDVAKRVARHRAKNKEIASESIDAKTKMLQCNNDVTNCNDILELELDKELDKDIDKDIEDKPISKSKRFVKPTIEELENYCKEKHIQVDCERFYNYYESNGWKVGKNSMKNWKSALTNWSKRDFGYSKQTKEVSLPDWYDNYKNREEDKADDVISTDGFNYFGGVKNE